MLIPHLDCQFQICYLIDWLHSVGDPCHYDVDTLNRSYLSRARPPPPSTARSSPSTRNPIQPPPTTLQPPTFAFSWNGILTLTRMSQSALIALPSSFPLLPAPLLDSGWSRDTAARALSIYGLSTPLLARNDVLPISWFNLPATNLRSCYLTVVSHV